MVTAGFFGKLLSQGAPSSLLPTRWSNLATVRAVQSFIKIIALKNMILTIQDNDDNPTLNLS